MYICVCIDTCLHFLSRQFLHYDLSWSWLSSLYTKTFSKILQFSLTPASYTMTLQIQKENKCNVGLRDRKTTEKQKNTRYVNYLLCLTVLDTWCSYELHYRLKLLTPESVFFTETQSASDLLLHVKILDHNKIFAPICAFLLSMELESCVHSINWVSIDLSDTHCAGSRMPLPWKTWVCYPKD